MAVSIVNMKYVDGKAFDIADVERLTYEIVLLSVDSINEGVLVAKILKTGNVSEFFTVAVQLSLTGFGGADYKQYRFNNKDCEIKDFFKKYGFVIGNKGQNNLSEDTLTPRRLIRVFRKQIQQLLMKREELSSYLFRKYTSQDAAMRTICFAGSEHMCKTQEEANFIFKAYVELDEALKQQNKVSGISVRIKRVLFARGFKTNV